MKMKISVLFFLLFFRAILGIINPLGLYNGSVGDCGVLCFNRGAGQARDSGNHTAELLPLCQDRGHTAELERTAPFSLNRGLYRSTIYNYYNEKSFSFSPF